MHAFRSSTEERRNLLTVPFKAYIFGVPIAVLTCRIVSRITGQDLPNGLRYSAGLQIARENQHLFSNLKGGYIVCALALVLIGIFVLSDPRSRRSALIWGLVAIAIAALSFLGSQPVAWR
jgi:hypothetical protein